VRGNVGLGMYVTVDVLEFKNTVIAVNIYKPSRQQRLKISKIARYRTTRPKPISIPLEARNYL
jgi:hypothetical protein